MSSEQGAPIPHAHSSSKRSDPFALRRLEFPIQTFYYLHCGVRWEITSEVEELPEATRSERMEIGRISLFDQNSRRQLHSPHSRRFLHPITIHEDGRRGPFSMKRCVPQLQYPFAESLESRSNSKLVTVPIHRII